MQDNQSPLNAWKEAAKLLDQARDKLTAGINEALMQSYCSAFSQDVLNGVYARVRFQVDEAKHQIQEIYTCRGPVISPATMEDIQDHLTNVDKALYKILEEIELLKHPEEPEAH